MIGRLRKVAFEAQGTGKIVKRDDHLMDATRYLVVSGREVMRGPRKPPLLGPTPLSWRGPNGWMAN